jgi:hypothetical protein
LPPVVSILEALRFIKSNSSGWVHDKWPRRSFAWQLGYGAFSVSKSNAPEVLMYIGNQDAHPRKHTLKGEFVDLLRKHEIDYENGIFGNSHVARVRALKLHRASNPQLALWATGMASASPTTPSLTVGLLPPSYFSIFFRIRSA